MGILAVLAVGFGFGLHALHHKAEAGPRPRTLARRANRPHHPGAPGLPGPDAAARPTPSCSTRPTRSTSSSTKNPSPGRWPWKILKPSCLAGCRFQLEPRAKDGHITLHLRVVGPRDRAVELVQNLEHSRHFLDAAHRRRNLRSQRRPNQRLEPVSASNRFNFDLLADYNPRSRRNQRPQSRRKIAAGDSLACRAHPAPGSHPRIYNGPHPPYTGPARNPSSNAIPGGPR